MTRCMFRRMHRVGKHCVLLAAIIFFFSLILVLQIFQKSNYEEELEGVVLPRMSAFKNNETFGTGTPLVTMNFTSEPESITFIDPSWQNVTGTSEKCIVYSAYLDQRDSFNVVRVIGAAVSNFYYEGLHCLLRLEDTSRRIVRARVEIIREHWEMKYSAIFILCSLRTLNESVEIPTHVSIMANFIEAPGNELIIRNRNEYETAKKDSIAICVKPLHYNYHDTSQLIEFIEFNTILGVSHFTFYNHSISEQVDCLLRNYSNSGRVTVLPWNMPLQSQKDIRTENMFAAFNDCLYRFMYAFEYVAFLDLDEFIVPKDGYTLQDLLRIVRRVPRHSAFSFRNAFFYLQWEDDARASDLISQQLTVLKKTRRTIKLHPVNIRSKYICLPERVVEVGNHFVWQFLAGYTGAYVDAELAVLHHYRVCEYGGDECVRAQSIVDNTTRKYAPKLKEAFGRKYLDLQTNKFCQRID